MTTTKRPTPEADDDASSPSSGSLISSSHLRTALEASPTAAMIVGADGTILHTNRKLEKLFGYERDELANQAVEILVPSDKRVQHPELREAFFDYPSPRSMGTGRELYGVAKSGTMIPVEIGLNPVETDRGVLVMTTVLDIRERKRHEERFRRALDAAPSAIVMVDSAGVIVLCNQLTEEVFGHSREHLVGQPIEILIPRKLHRKHGVYRSSFFNEPQRRTMGQGRELWGVRADGTEFPVEVALQPLVTDDAQFVISSILDVSKRKAAEREIRQKNENLTQLNEDLSAFAYSASHDLKAPLATIRGLSQCILEDLEANRLGEVRTNIGRIEVLTERLSTLVEDVLSVARSEAQGESGTFRVDEQIRLSVAKHSELQSRHGVEVDLSAVGSIELESELVRFTSIIDNLISNAFRYSDPDKAHRVVEVSAECIDDALHVEVRDNGLGIPKEMHERIFRMFERAHARVPDGSGLGLALARKHAERLGGEISLKIRDEWTIFSVRIPMSIASHLKEAGDPK